MTVAQRITITIPDALHERLQRVKDSLNVSQICQREIERFVQIEEIKQKESPAMEKLLERLRIEKQQSDAAWKAEGVTDGKEDATDLSYDEFCQIETEGLSEDLLDWIRNKRIRYLENPTEEAYLEGWKEGTLCVWKQVKEQL
ncbi:MAG: hypothetical protein KME16_27515 [Scytolyngbya sp. HA4215-MV1]|nr:hypothetical protein [Scytolyngbya sp. HA4215-MV1]